MMVMRSIPPDGLKILQRNVSLIILLIALCVGAISVGLSPAISLAVVIVLFFFTILKVLSRLMTSSTQKDFLAGIFLLGLLLRVIATFFLYCLLINIQGIPFLLGQGGDDYIYDHLGWQIAQTWRRGYNYSIPTNLKAYPGYLYFNAAIYFVFGHVPLVARLLNCFLGSLVIIYVYLIAKYVYDEKIARLAAILTAIFPNLIIWSGLQYKDTLLVFLVVLIFWHMLKIKEKFQWRRIPIIALFIFALFSLRRQAAVAIALLIGVYLLMHLRFRRTSLKSKITFVIVIAMLLLLITLLGESPLGYKTLPLGRIAKFRETRLEQFSSSSVLISFVGGKSFFSRIYLWPIYLMLPLIMPMPTFVSIPSPYLISDKVFMSGQLIWLTLFPFFLYGLWRSFLEKRLESFPLYIWVIATVFGVLMFFYIMPLRQRVQIVPINMIFTAVGMLRLKKKIQRQLLGVYFFIILPLMIIGYNLVRLKLYGML